MSTKPGKTLRDKLSRRQFLTAAGGATLALAGCHPHAAKPPVAPASKPAAPLPAGKFLSGPEMGLCAAACARILPTDADPGATELGVVDYIDGRMARPGKRAAQAARRLRKGLALLADWSQKRNQKPFAELGPEDQDVTLASLAGEGGDEAYAFVKNLVMLTMEGALADPIYGGNRAGGGWKLIGFDAPCPNPRCK